MVLLDDFERSLHLLSDFGREACLPHGRLLYGQILKKASRDPWKVLSYDAFVSWLVRHQKTEQLCVVADKLFPTDQLTGPFLEMEAHRAFVPDAEAPGGLVNRIRPAADAALKKADHIWLLDDAIYTGSTIDSMIRQFELHDKKITLTCLCSKQEARAKFLAQGIAVEALHIAEKGKDILHLHDFFPFFPFSGRRVSARSGAHNIQHFRLCNALYKEGSWLHIEKDKEIKNAVWQFLKTTVLKMDQLLGRATLVKDIALLGPGVELQLLHPHQPFHAEETLQAIYKTELL